MYRTTNLLVSISQSQVRHLKHTLTLSAALTLLVLNWAPIHEGSLTLPNGTLFLGSPPSHLLCSTASPSQLCSPKLKSR